MASLVALVARVLAQRNCRTVCIGPGGMLQPQDRTLLLIVAATVTLVAVVVTVLVYALLSEPVRGRLLRKWSFAANGHESFAGLDHALDEAAKLNPFHASIHINTTPHVSARYSPTSYEEALNEVARLYRDGRAVVIDLARLEERHAIRLIDHCSGMALATAGWIFRATSTAVILTPLVTE